MGNLILGFLGISVHAFRVAGGVMLLGIAFSMLNDHPITNHERGDYEKKPDPGPGAVEDGIAFYPAISTRRPRKDRVLERSITSS